MRAPIPTQAELDILAVLWRRGSATVRDIHDELHPSRGTGYTTTLKLMQLMVGKGLLMRDARQRSHVYTTPVEAATAQRRVIGRLIDRIFGGSTRALVQVAVEANEFDVEELADIRALLAAYPRKPGRAPARSERGVPGHP